MAPEIVCYCEHRLKNILPKSNLILPTIVAKVFWNWKFLESFEEILVNVFGDFCWSKSEVKVRAGAKAAPPQTLP